MWNLMTQSLHKLIPKEPSQPLIFSHTHSPSNTFQPLHRNPQQRKPNKFNLVHPSLIPLSFTTVIKSYPQINGIHYLIKHINILHLDEPSFSNSYCQISLPDLPAPIYWPHYICIDLPTARHWHSHQSSNLTCLSLYVYPLMSIFPFLKYFIFDYVLYSFVIF